MRVGSRFPVPGGVRVTCIISIVSFVLAASCSRSVSPVVDGGGNARRATGSAAQTSLVVLHFVGPVATLDAAFQPRIDRHADFYVA